MAKFLRGSENIMKCYLVHPNGGHVELAVTRMTESLSLGEMRYSIEAINMDYKPYSRVDNCTKIVQIPGTEERKMYESYSVEEMRRQAARMLAEAARLEARPKDEYEDGSVLTWGKDFNRADERVYYYTAIKCSEKNSGSKIRCWFVSGNKTGGWMSWDQLLDFIERDGGTVDGLWFASGLTEVTW